jgi:hypothetical protein
MSEVIKCTSCGATNLLPEGKKSMFCSFCGTPIEPQKESIVFVPSANPEDNPQIKNFLELAKNAEESNNFEEAIRYFNKTLEFNPKIAEAWFGKGYCSGWSGNLRTIKINEMVINFKKALECSSEGDLKEMTERIVIAINGCSFAVYQLSYNHTVEFAMVDGTFQEHLGRSMDVLRALVYAHTLDMKSTRVLDSLVKISENLLTPIRFKNYDDKYGALRINSEARQIVNDMRLKYSTQLALLNPAYASEIENKVQNGNVMFYVGIAGLVLAFIFYKADNLFYAFISGVIGVFLAFYGFRVKTNYESVLAQIKPASGTEGQKETRGKDGRKRTGKNTTASINNETPNANSSNSTSKQKSYQGIIVGGILLVVVVIALLVRSSNQNGFGVNSEKAKQDSIFRADSLGKIAAMRMARQESVERANQNNAPNNSRFTTTSVLEKVKAYYQAVSRPDFDASLYFSRAIYRYINETAITPMRVTELVSQSRGEFTNEEVTLKENTLTQHGFGSNGINLRLYQYMIHYKCFRTSKKKTEECDVLLEVGMDEDNYIASYSELRMDNLTFSDNVESNEVRNDVPYVAFLNNLDIRKLDFNQKSACINGNCKDGQGTYLWNNIGVYSGGWKNGKQDGAGIYNEYSNDEKVVGNNIVGYWKDGELNGQTTFIFRHKIGDPIIEKYVGEYKYGLANGEGTHTYIGGTEYSGHWKNGKYNGYGTYTSANGEKMTGQWKDNTFER